MYIQNYIQMLDQGIDKLIEKESKGLSMEAEKSLHVLMENRKHAKRLMEEKHGTAPMMGESMGHMAEGNPHHMATAKNPY